MTDEADRQNEYTITDVTESKESLRRECLARRKVLTEEVKERAAILLCERILGHQWFYRSGTILGFVSYGTEIDVTLILEEALRLRKRLYVPKVLEDGRMSFFRIGSLEELQTGYRGIREPSGDTERYEYSEEGAKDCLLLMPGVAFDPYHNRIGYGGGFYDRYLADKEALRLRSIAVGFACQMVERIPAEANDRQPCQTILV